MSAELRMIVDETLCQGHALCVREAPDIFELSDDGEYASVVVDPIPGASTQGALDALAGCPEQAIREVTRTDQ